MLTIKNGKFFRDGQPVPLEFGNKEQIELMEHENRVAKAFLDKDNHVDVEIETSYHAKATFKCSCGQTVWFEAESDWNEDDAKDDLEETESRCHRCLSTYSIHKKGRQFFVAQVKKSVPA